MGDLPSKFGKLEAVELDGDMWVRADDAFKVIEGQSTTVRKAQDKLTVLKGEELMLDDVGLGYYTADGRIWIERGYAESGLVPISRALKTKFKKRSQ